MEITKKFYKFSDPITGAQTKSIGWVKVYTPNRAKIVKKDDIYTLVYQEAVPTTSISKPNIEGAVEITEDEFNGLDTSNESVTYKLKRESKQFTFSKLNRVSTVERDFTQVVTSLNAKLARA